MAHDYERRKKIFARTDGHCHLCHGTLNFHSYGIPGMTGAWEVEHSVPRAYGGSDHGNNLYAAHISCNRSKGTQRSRTFRKRNGVTRAPYSRARKAQIQDDNTLGGALTGGLVGGALFGRNGAVWGTIIGGIIGYSNSPSK